MYSEQDRRHQPLIIVLRKELAREYEKINVATAEILKLKLELLDLGIDISQDAQVNSL